ncbi:carcinoembryonic antigen-related cell adhesion molecule 5-like [Myxocyprinus asiaticus]|uniref:carcinoembryonic antigen-related cell adhesion molecule 5-like n=1 Tax=Myxocyprinus asiaticus TaxID=70543 RepID=UPI0022213279|nr:carcinoembryonic antigen-related cell adhesion molecule 5-like [Myxocyprinus asiaticus]
MEFKLFAFITLICTPGLYALTVVSPKNPVAVGSNVTLSLNDSKAIPVGSWLYGPTVLVVWFPGDSLVGSSFNKEIAFNNITYELTLTSVTLRSSGLYVIESLKPLLSKGEFRLEVQEPVSNLSLNISNTNLVEFNESMTFTCSARGTPTWFSWQNGSTVVTAGGRVELRNDGQVLAINSVMRYDQGPFKCIVANNISKEESTQITLTISYGPSNLTITALPEKTAYASDSAISMTCSADSKPTASFYWTYNKVPLNVNGPNIKLTNTTQNQTGQYTCIAQNAVTLRYDAVTKTIRIVDPISSVVVNPSAGNPIKNMPFRLTCDVVGPEDSIHWIKNGMYLLPDNKITLSSDNSTLNFNQLTHNDDGQYLCEASNAVSSMTSSAYNLIVNYGPWNTSISGPAIGAAGSNVTFSCSAISHPQSQFSWFFNSSKVAEGSVHVTGVLSLNNAGQYTCMAFNNITGSSSNASVQLTIKYPPRDVVVFSNQQPIFNQSFTLTCHYKGDVDSIQWMKNGMSLLPDNTITLSSDNSTLNFNQLTHNDDGQYLCEASNAVSSMTSSAYNLILNYGPWNTAITGPAMSEIGSTVTFICSANSYPQSQYSWFFNSSKVAVGPVFVTEVLLPNNSGQYICMAFSNITGSSNNASVVFTVIDGVTVSVSSNPLIPLASQNLQLFCNVDGHYNSLHWLRNNQTFQASNRVTISVDNTTVNFKPLQTSNNGKYQCVATNIFKQHISQPYSLVANSPGAAVSVQASVLLTALFTLLLPVLHE